MLATLEIPAALQSTLDGALVAIGLFLSGALVWGLGQARTWMRDRSWKAAHAKLDAAAEVGQQAAEQIRGQFLREAEPAGKLNDSQRRDIMAKALEVSRLHLGTATWAEIAKTLELDETKLTALLQSKIEAAIHRAKKTMPAVVGTLTEFDGSTSRTMTVSTTVGEPQSVSPDASTVRNPVGPDLAADSGPVTR